MTSLDTQTVRARARRNPIYQAFLRTRILHRMVSDFYDTDPAVQAAVKAYGEESQVLRRLADKGIISEDQFDASNKLACRSMHAAALMAARRKSSLRERRWLNRLVLKTNQEGGRIW